MMGYFGMGFVWGDSLGEKSSSGLSFDQGTRPTNGESANIPIARAERVRAVPASLLCCPRDDGASVPM